MGPAEGGQGRTRQRGTEVGVPGGDQVGAERAAGCGDADDRQRTWRSAMGHAGRVSCVYLGVASRHGAGVFACLCRNSSSTRSTSSKLAPPL
jgi:hypothetical protein